MAEIEEYIGVLRHRAFAYIIRGDLDDFEILVFLEKEYPDVGLQVPGGGIDDHESPDDAVLREVREETGIDDARIIVSLPPYAIPDWKTMAFPYLLRVDHELPDKWDFLSNDFHDEAGRLRGDCLTFCYSWIPKADIGILNGPQVEWIQKMVEIAKT